MNYPKIVEIIEEIKENKNVKTFKFNFPVKTIPGQFFMVWIPDIDEVPMSVSYINGNIKGITFKRVGEATNALFNYKIGDKIGIRGPYGNGFKIKGKKILFVAGGTGIAMILPAVENVINKNILSTVIIGVKNKDELFFVERLRNLGTELYISTDNGSEGHKGYASDLSKKIIEKSNFDLILTCGPEIMMKKLFDISKNIPFEASLERFMKCGIGICGQCCVGNGLRVCKEGPIFDKKTLTHIDDFGKFKRDSSGRKINF